MDDAALEMLARLPLAEAVLRLWRWVGDNEFLEDFYERHRGRFYRKILTFPALVHLLSDALLKHNGSARQSFDRADENDAMPVSIQAAYGKLRRIPIGLSESFLSECTDRLRMVMPEPVGDSIPRSMVELEVVVLDGKIIKKLAKRLKALRNIPGGALGGQTVVALSLRSGLAVGMHAHPDGHRNEVRLVPDLLSQLRERFDGPRLWVADRAYSYPSLLNDLSGEEDFFVVRLRSDITFTPDPGRCAIETHDRLGRPNRQEWGWLGRVNSPNRTYVRRVTLERGQEASIVLVTNLLDDQRYAVQEVLDLYLSRWDIERVFQKVTEVFNLQHLIGSTPEASVFQFGFCLLLYNMLHVVRAVLASVEQRPVETISLQKLFIDVREHLIAWGLVIGPSHTSELWSGPLTMKEVSQHLASGLTGTCKKRWTKAPPKKPKPRTQQSSRSTHVSAHRILQEYRCQAKP